MNPELIPDLTAYRLYFAMVSQPASPTDVQKTRQQTQLGKIGLNDADSQTVVSILANFNVQYQSWISKYNEAATAAWAQNEEPPDPSLLLERDNLVQSTHDTLEGVLTAAGWAMLDAHVHGEKKQMKTSAQVVGQ